MMATTTRVMALVIVASIVDVASAQDWPMARRDRARTALQTLAGNIDAPAVRWRIPMGGSPFHWFVDDVTLDGEADVVMLRGGRALARRFDGVVTWASEPLGLDFLFGAADLDGNGRPEVYAGSTLQGVFALDGGSGGVLWSPSWTAGLLIGDVWTIDMPDGSELLYVSDRDNRGAGGGRIFDLSGGFGSVSQVAALDLSSHGYWRGAEQDAGDLDNDGVPEIVALNDNGIVAYDVMTGSPKYTSGDIGRWPFGRATTTVTDLDGDGRDEIILSSSQPPAQTSVGRRLVIAHLVGSTIEVRFQELFDPDDGIHSFVRHPVGDLAADVPGLEVATSVYEPGTGWRVLVWAGTAVTDDPPILTVNGQRLVEVTDVNGDGAPELVTAEATGPTIAPLSTIRALRIMPGGGTQELWSHDNAELVVDRTDWRRRFTPIALPDDGVLVVRDTDGDGRTEQIISAGGTAPSRTLRRSFSSARAISLPEGPVAVATSEGSIELLDAQLEAQNVDMSGVTLLQETTQLAQGAVVSAGATPTLVTVDGTQSLTAVRLQDDSTTTLWQRSEQLPSFRGIAPTFLWLDQRVLFHERLQNGTLNLVVLDGATGNRMGEHMLGASSFVEPLNAAFPLDSAPESVLQATYDNQSRFITYRSIFLGSGSMVQTGLSRMLSGGMDPLPAIFEVGMATTFVLPQARSLVVANRLTGEPVSSSNVLMTPGGTPSAHTFGSDSSASIIYGGAFGVERLDSGIASQWAFDTGERHVAPAAQPAAGTTGRVATVRQGEPLFTLLDAADGTVVTEGVLAGGQVFADRPAADAAGVTVGVASDITAMADLDGSGTEAFLVSSSDGHLYALDAADGTLIWALNLRSRLGAPIAADLDGDGVSDIIVPAGDGSIYVVGRAELSTPDSVFDTDGTFIATSDAEDLDVLPSSTSIGGNWTTVAGATDYDYQIVRDDDLVVVAWTSVGTETSFVRTDLALQSGFRYFILVRANDRSGSSPRVSEEVSSDGFEIQDEAPPEVDIVVAPDFIWVADSMRSPTETTITATFRDAIALNDYRIHIETDAGDEVIELDQAPTGGTIQIRTVVWDGRDSAGDAVAAGEYFAVGTATDAEGSETSEQASIRACAEDDPECVPPEPVDAGMGDAGADAGVDSSVPTEDAMPPDADDDAGPEAPFEVEGGCGCRVTPEGPQPWGLLVMGLVAVLYRRRRKR